jgi:hypothetical protein
MEEIHEYHWLKLFVDSIESSESALPLALEGIVRGKIGGHALQNGLQFGIAVSGQRGNWRQLKKVMQTCSNGWHFINSFVDENACWF